MTMLGLSLGLNRGGGVAFDPSTLPGFLYDSGENPAVPTTIASSVAVDTSSCEVWIVSTGIGSCPLDLGTGSQAMYYAGGISASAANSITFLDNGGFRFPKANQYWPRVAPTIHGYFTGGGTIKAHINGIYFTGVSFSSQSTTGGRIGGRVTGGFALDGTAQRVLIYSGNLSSGNREALLAHLRTRYSVQAYSKQVICAGDSLTAGYHSTENFISNGWSGGDFTYSFPYYVAQSYRDWKVLNRGITGKKIVDMTTDDTGGVDPYYDATNIAKNVCVVWGGTNDLVIDSTSLATLQSRVSAYCAARKTAGWKVVYVPMMDRSGFSGAQRTIKNDFNSWLTGGGLGSDCDALVTLPTQLAGDSPWSTYSTFWDPDQTHLTRLGYQTLAPAVATAVLAV